MERIYGQSWWWTILKSGALGLLYLFLIQPIVVATFATVIAGM